MADPCRAMWVLAHSVSSRIYLLSGSLCHISLCFLMSHELTQFTEQTPELLGWLRMFFLNQGGIIVLL